MQEGLEPQALQASLDFSSRVPEHYAVRKALQLLNDTGIGGLPPIRMFTRKPFWDGIQEIQTSAYVQMPQRDTIYVNDATQRFRRANTGKDEQALAALAAAIAHENHHVLNGKDEKSAYETQLKVLSALGGNRKEQQKVTEALDWALTQHKSQ